MRVRSLPSALLDLLYPRDCVVTHSPLGETRFRYLSERAFARLPMIRDPSCPTCGHPFYGSLEESPVCHNCELLNPNFSHGKCGFTLSRDIKTLIHAFKYQKKSYLARDLAALLATAPGFLTFLENAVVIPVPLHPRKLRRRGFNQTEILLRELHLQSPVNFDIEPLLKRVIDTDSQTRADRKERIRQIAGAFAVSKRSNLTQKSRRYVIFDDIFTTGATLNACATVLRAIGIEILDVAAFAHG
ncbi:MAG: double zinc ribbon domain-containing protein [Verrucomicrobiota bacterium]